MDRATADKLPGMPWHGRCFHLRNMQRIRSFSVVVLAILAAVACSDNGSSTQASGGASGSGASAGSGASGGTAGSGASGGSTGSGGFDTSGGSAGVGGAGASAGSAGTSASGGATGSGGSAGAAGSGGGSGLLSGCTVGANNRPSCPTPSGWTLTAAQGFESGSLPSGQSFCSLTSIESTIAHSGTHAAGGEYTGGDQQDCWALQGSLVGSTTTYVSWWEYDDASIHTNEEMFLGRRTLTDSSGNFRADMTFDMGAPGASGCLWNCADASATPTFYDEGDGTTGPNFSIYGGQTTTFGKGVWTQWEVYLDIGAANAGTNGTMMIWRNGAQVYTGGGRNFAGAYDYTNATVQVGGVYTYLVWWLDSAHTQCPNPAEHTSYTTNYGDWSKPDPCPDQAPSGGYGFPFHRYFDDIVVLKK